MCVLEERGSGVFETGLPLLPPKVLRDTRYPSRIARRTITLEPVPHKGKDGRATRRANSTARMTSQRSACS